jgi:hypothetical protein
MTNTGKIVTAGLLGAAAIFALVTLVDVDVSGDLEMPNIEMSAGDIELPSVETSGGEMPAVDVNTAEINYVDREATVSVPTDVNVQTEEKTISVPSFEYTSPEENTIAEENDLK